MLTNRKKILIGAFTLFFILQQVLLISYGIFDYFFAPDITRSVVFPMFSLSPAIDLILIFIDLLIVA